MTAEFLTSKRAKRAIRFFIVGLLLALGSLIIYQSRSASPHVSDDPSTYLASNEISAIQATVEEGAHPNTYLNATEIAAIRARVEAGAEPWQTAYQRMIAEANQALLQAPHSVTLNGGPDDGHDYDTNRVYCGWTAVDGQAPDCRDGQKNPAVTRQDYNEAIALGKEVSTLGLAYAFTQEAQYADQLIAFIRAWCISPETRMNPSFNNQQSKIELLVSLPGMFYGADLAYSYAGWTAADKEKFEDWASQMAQSASSWHRSNNFENWRVHFIALLGSFLKEDSLLNYSFGRYKELIPSQIDRNGKFVQELERTNSLAYSLYALNAMIQTAELARHQGVDLYGYTTDKGIGLKLAADYHARFAAKESAEDWPYEQIAPLSETENVALYEMAYAHWHEPQYLAVINSWGRPMTDRRVQWQITLTHACLD